MYYIFASLVVGAFIGGSTLVSQPAHNPHPVASTALEASAQSSDASPIIVDDNALSPVSVNF
jgi:hypothetical protein